MTPPPLPAFLIGLRCSQRSFQPGDSLDFPGLTWVDQGMVRLFRQDQTLFHVGAGDVFGEAGLFSTHTPYQAIAVRAGQARQFAARSVLLHLRAHADLSLAFAAFATQRLDRMRQLAEILRQKGADHRILAYLLAQGADQAPVRVTETLSSLATTLGLTHEALYRTLRSLQSQGRLIRLDRHCFQIPAPITDARPADPAGC